MDYAVYILQSERTLEFYKGHTDDLPARIKRHNSGFESSTKHGIPWILIWSAPKETKSEAVVLEKKLKNLGRERAIQFIEKYKENQVSRVLTFPPEGGKSGVALARRYPAILKK